MKDIILCIKVQGGFFMKKEIMQVVSNAGNIAQELKEINKIQKNPDSFLTMWSNTCTDFLTVLCC